MLRLLFIIILAVSFLGSFGQTGKVRDQMDSSFESVKKGWNSANKALGEIQKCNISISVNEVQSIAAKAKSEMEEALAQAKQAEEFADAAEGEAQNIGCSGAVDGASHAEKIFKKAKGKFDDAVAKLNDASDEDRIEYLIDYLNSAISVIETGMDYLKKGTDELTRTSKALDNCK